jgi:hypothetical protein
MDDQQSGFDPRQSKIFFYAPQSKDRSTRLCIQFVSGNFSLEKGDWDLNLMIRLQLMARLIMFPQNLRGVVLN